MTYWEYEYFTDDLREYLKEEKKRNDQQNKEFEEQQSNIRSKYKMPSGYKLPTTNFKMPKFK